MIETIMIWVIFGTLTGLLSAAITPRETMLILKHHIIPSVLGALIGGYVYSIFSNSVNNSFDMMSVFVSILGSAIILTFIRSYQEHETR